jgi:hypothetical protein
MYSGHGSAEWANAARAVITIDTTNDPEVFEFRAAKRGAKSGWEKSAKGEFIKYFRHATNGDIFWFPASEEDIKKAQDAKGVSLKDIIAVIGNDVFGLEVVNHLGRKRRP